MRTIVWACAVTAIACGGSSHGATDAPQADAQADAHVPDGAPDAGAAIQFAAAVDFTTAANPTFLVLVDVDGDGKLDIVAADTNVRLLSILVNTTAAGATTPTFAAKVDVPTGQSPAGIAVADFNADGKPDLATANVGSNTASILLNTSTIGTISFAAPVDFVVGGAPEFAAAGDLDGDGRPDVAIANLGSNSISVLVNTTPAHGTVASFGSAVDFAAGSGTVSLAIGDINGDDELDLVSANLTANTVSVLLNTTIAEGTPTFAANVDLPAGSDANAIVLADVDDDNKLDVIVCAGVADAASFLLNTTASGASTPSFAAKQDLVTGNQPDGIAVGDLDGDGKPDLVTADFDAPGISVLRATATTPAYAAAQSFTTSGTPRAVAIGDLNGDGKPDLVVADGAVGVVSVLLAR